MLSYFYSALGFNKLSLIYSCEVWQGEWKKKKTPETIKKELLASVLEVFKEEDYLQICQEVKKDKDLKDGISLVKKYEELKQKHWKYSCKTGRVA